VALQDMA